MKLTSKKPKNNVDESKEYFIKFLTRYPELLKNETGLNNKSFSNPLSC
jgi:hypothetical protein